MSERIGIVIGIGIGNVCVCVCVCLYGIFVVDCTNISQRTHSLSSTKKGPIETVYKFLEDRNSLALLEDPLIDIATREILAEKKTRQQITQEIRRKERAVAHLKQNYRSQTLSSEDVHLCLYSIW